jgi:hypothetical protein
MVSVWNIAFLRCVVSMCYQMSLKKFSTTEGSGARGRPLKIWSAYVREDLDAIGHACDWWIKFKDSEDWKEIIQVLLDVPSP